MLETEQVAHPVPVHDKGAGLLLYRRDGRVVEVNSAYVSMLEYNRDEILGRALWEFDPEVTPDSMESFWEAVPDGATRYYRGHHERTDGTLLPVEMLITRVTIGGTDYHVGTVRDLTSPRKNHSPYKRYERLISKMGGQTFILDPDGHYREVNDYLGTLSGYEPGEIVGSDPGLLHTDEEIERFEQAIEQLLKNDDEDRVKRIEATLEKRNGETIPIEVYLTLLPRENGEFQGTMGVVRDVSDERQRQRELDRYKTVLETMPDTVTVTDMEGTMLAVHGFEGWSGYDREELIGESIEETATEGTLERARQAGRELFENDDIDKVTYEHAIQTRDGRIIPHENHMAFLPPDEDGIIPGIVSVLRDVSERKILEEKLRHQALHDDLTDLPNRSLFMDHLEERLDRLQENDEEQFAVVYMDLDRFKMINDSLGHHVGDELLKGVAGRLQDAVDDTTTVARLGGDEFAVLLEDLEDSDEALMEAERISRIIERPFELDDERIFSRASLGVVAPEPGEYDDPEVLIRNADIAMYRSKKSNERCTLFEPKMHEETEAEMKLEMQLQDALDNGELEVHYQPILRIDDDVDDVALGFEALVRWKHPERGFLAPGEFLPLAKKTGFMLKIDRWVLQQACRHLKQWRDRHPERNLFVSVNCSQVQFMDPAFEDLVADNLVERNLDPDTLYLEITERTVVGNPDRASEVINTLQDEGVHIVLDDFGTGYSSLNYLSSLSIDLLNIDRAFVYKFQYEADGKTSHRMIRVIMNMAESTDTGAITNQIQSDQDVRSLLGLDCAPDRFPQDDSFHFAEALNAAEVESLMDRV